MCSRSVSALIVLLQFPHKGMQALGIHGHVFVNGGNLSLFSGTNRTLHQIVSEDFTQRWRWTAVRHSTCCIFLSMPFTSACKAYVSGLFGACSACCVFFLVPLHFFSCFLLNCLCAICLIARDRSTLAYVQCCVIAQTIYALQGVGVRWQTTIGTLEVNACQVLAHQQHDRPRFGLQFGVIPTS